MASSPPAPQETSPESSIFAALGAVLGYIGAEAATVLSFERLLWPQRYYANFSFSSALLLGLLMPMGGPLHKAALKTLDVFFAHGLFKGPYQGHMLDTAFFRPLSWSYTTHGGGPPRTRPLRNCLWARALSRISIPALDPTTGGGAGGSAEKGTAATTLPVRPPLRAHIAVNHLTLSRPTADEIACASLPFVSESAGSPNRQAFLAICACEVTGIGTAFGILVASQSPWAVLWLVPLFLRILSAVFALDREPLVSTSSVAMSDPAGDYELDCPQSEGGFMLMTGPPTLVLQFFRHYGHPVRNRCREAIQILVVVSFGIYFPAGLLCSVIWMPQPIQYVWLCYQLYVVLAMHVARYTHIGWSTSTETRIALLLSADAETACASGTKTAAKSEREILFGHQRDGAGTIKASLITTYHNRYGEGRDCIERLLRRHKPQ